MNFAGVQSVTIPEGDVKSIAVGGVTVWTKPNPLPYDAEVEYIQANGIAYIDTGVPFTTDYTAKCKFQFVSASSENLSPFGFWYASQPSGGTQRAARMYWRGGSSDWRYQYPTTSAAVFASGSSMPFGDVHELEIGPSGVKMDGSTVSVSAASWSDASYTQSLFGAQSYDPYNHAIKHEMQSASSIIRIFSASWTDGNGNLVRDFVPCRVGTEARIYDRVTGEFFAKQGAGTFTPGPDKNGG